MSKVSMVFLMGAIALAGCGQSGTKVDVSKEGTNVRAPGVDVKTGSGGTNVVAPGVNVKAGEGGADVAAPGVDVKAKP